jgi:3-methyl-2-oxobutanoate hydroxymethyltransferase
MMQGAFQDYIKEVQEGSYPTVEHTFKINDDVMEKLY